MDAGTPIRILSAGAPRVGIQQCAEAYCATAGVSFAIDFATAPVIKDRLEKGTVEADVIVAPASAMSRFVEAGRIDPESIVPVGSIAAGVVIRDGASEPDLSSPGALRQALLEADAIVYNQASSGQYATDIARLQAEVYDLRTKNVSKQELAKLRLVISKHTNVVDGLMKRDVELRRVLDEHSKGVCLVHGVWMLNYYRNGRPYPLRDRKGKALKIEYVGSGFLATKDGWVVTNRHVAEPWWRNKSVQKLIERGFEPTFIQLQAVFPGRKPTPIQISSIKSNPDGLDVSIMKVNSFKDVPVLPLDDGNISIHRGKKIVLLGYPTGMKALLARSDPKVAAEVLKKAKVLSDLIVEYADRGLISPIITQGALNEAREKRLVYDAGTTSGGSGGPVFGPNGKVIGVNFAITADFDGSNFGVPIRYVRDLLKSKP